MKSTIFFNGSSDLAEFLEHYNGTKQFDVVMHRGGFLLTFSGAE